MSADASILGRPFLKWPGGKRWLAPVIAAFLRDHRPARYIEPFLGGGATFLAARPERALLGDVNAELITTYDVIRNDLPRLIDRLKRLRVSENDFYAARSRKPRTPLTTAVRMLYLNRLSFNGIYRLNRKGEFNVPYGDGVRRLDTLWRQGILQAASHALQAAELFSCDFEVLLNRATRGDFVYCDPAYTVAHNNNGFRRYNERVFAWEDQERLAVAARKAVGRGATVLVSNADHDALIKLYEGAHVQRVMRRSTVASNVAARGEVTEALIWMRPSEG